MLIINADDFGKNEKINKAILYCFENRLCSSTTIMANMPGFEHACQLAQEKHLTNHIGIHLVLTSGVPLTDAIKSCQRFCDPSGRFKRDARKKRIFHLSSTEKTAVADEIRTQISRCRDRGLPITHLDSHNHIHEEAAIASLLVPILRESEIPYIRIMSNTVPAGTTVRHLYTCSYNAIIKTMGLAKTRFFGCIQTYERFMHNANRHDRDKPLEIMIHPILDQDNIVLEAETQKPVDEIIRTINNYEKAESFSGSSFSS